MGDSKEFGSAIADYPNVHIDNPLADMLRAEIAEERNQAIQNGNMALLTGHWDKLKHTVSGNANRGGKTAQMEEFAELADKLNIAHSIILQRRPVEDMSNPVPRTYKMPANDGISSAIERAEARVRKDLLSGSIEALHTKVYRYMPGHKGIIQISGKEFIVSNGMIFAESGPDVKAIMESDFLKRGVIRELNYEQDRDFLDALSPALRDKYKKNTAFSTMIRFTAEEIQADFRAASIVMLERVKDILQQHGDNAELLELTKLADLGFNNSKEVKEKLEVIKILEKAKEEAKLFEHYAKYYPMNNFISDYDCERLCKKYGLVLGEPHRFIGGIPEKNRKEIVAFTLRSGDKVKDSRVIEIIAPKDLFDYRDNWDRMQEGYIMVDDPIVTHKVKGGRLMVSAWGYEATLPEVQNPNKN